MEYKEAVDYLLNIPKFAGKTSHDNLREFLERLGNPQNQVPAVHVAGTNGKGSTCAFLASILEQAGYQVGLFTSPHLIIINERFQMNGKPIDNETFLRMFQQVKKVVDSGVREGQSHPNFFEFLFLMAACWYREMAVDIVIYETGLGGRLDATNVLQPCLTILTSIGMDHMQYLGDTLEQIAGEKAGILKPETPCIYLRQKDCSAEVIEQRSRELQVPLIPVEKDKITIDEIGEQTIDFSYQNRYDIEYNQGGSRYQMAKTALYQLENAALAIEAGYFLLTEDYSQNRGASEIAAFVHNGIRAMYWRGRMEELEPGIYVDGAHNEPAIQAFCDTLVNIYRDKKIVLLFAVASDKRYNEMIRLLCENIDYEKIIVTAIEGTRATPIREVAEEFRKYVDCPIQTESDSEQALELARTCVNSQVRVFCVGSLYLVGSLEAGKEEES